MTVFHFIIVEKFIDMLMSLFQQVSYLEVHQEKIRDLLVEKKIEQREEESGLNCTFRQAESPLADGRGSSFSFRRPIKKDHIRIREHPVTGLLYDFKMT